jgi:outer membrane protein with beta-barrel domain
LSLAAANMAAQTPVHFGLGGGVSIPSGTTSDGLKTGWHGMALVQILPAASPVGFQIDGAYQQLNFDGGGGKDQVIDGTANVVYEFKTSSETRFRPYLIGGGGVYNIKAKPDVGPSPSSTKFGINAGAGFNFGAANTSLFVESRFHNVFVTGSDFHFIPITVGVRFGGSGRGA